MFSDYDISFEFQKLLPAPKTVQSQASFIEEEIDEFLTRKAVAVEKPPAKVKITIPCLSEFKDLECHRNRSSKNEVTGTKFGGLLSLLPKPKSDIFNNQPTRTDSVQVKTKSNTFLIPESVKKKIVVSKASDTSSKISLKNKLVSISDSDDSEEETDFFSLQKEVVLPKVNLQEIDEMVSRKAAKIAEAFTKAEAKVKIVEESSQYIAQDEEQPFNKHEAITVLSGHKEAKRRKVEEVEFIEISGDQVMPNRSEWYRTALASSTSYQRRGIVDEEDQPGTRRKNQITYLANQALANDSELQAMWSENRANRRATQNKYGF